MSAETPDPEYYPAGALPVGTRLGEFEVRRVLGIGGFGIVYHAFDHQLEREVAVKEYMPASLAGRTETLHVSLLSQSNADTFALGLRSFINEARLLARFDHPSLVKVYRYWEENSTAYMTMPLYRGQTLKAVRLSMPGSPNEAGLRTVLEPLLGAIDRLHQEGVYHRDIAPDNILIEADGHPVLLDFGAARRVISDKSQNLTAILKPSYAPIEQYGEAGSLKQGPWTDLYALGATMHFVLLGRPPMPATARALEDESRPLASMPLAGCSPALLQLIDWMLSPRPLDRPQSVAAVWQVLRGGSAPPTPSVPLTQPSQDWERTQRIVPGVTQTLVTPRPQPHGAEEAAAEAAKTVSVASTREQWPADETTRPRAQPVAAAEAQPQEPAAAPAVVHAAERPSSRAWIPTAAAVAALAIGGAWFAFKPAAPDSPAARIDPPSPASAAAPAVAGAPSIAPTNIPATGASPSSVAVAPPVASTPATNPTAPAEVPRVQAGQGKTAPQRAAASAPSPSKTVASRPPARPIEPAVRTQETAAAPASPAQRDVDPAPSPPPSARTATAPVPNADAAKTGGEADSGQSPSESCRKQVSVLKWVCMDLQCGKSRFQNHPECLKLRADQERARAAGNR